MKKVSSGIFFMLALLATVACSKHGTDEDSSSGKIAVPLVELADGTLVELSCLRGAAQMNVAPRQVCNTVTKEQMKGIANSREAVSMRGTCKKKCGDNYYYYCNGSSCGWNDFYGSPYYNTYYPTYQGGQYPSQYWNQFGIPNNYYYQYMYSYSYNYNQPNQGCNSNTFYGLDYARYGGCWSSWYWR